MYRYDNNYLLNREVTQRYICITFKKTWIGLNKKTSLIITKNIFQSVHECFYISSVAHTIQFHLMCIQMLGLGGIE